jgi:hypothetical protein
MLFFSSLQNKVKDYNFRYCHDLVDWWTDLLTTYTHHSELQVITALSLVSVIYNSPQHPLRLFPACYVFISRYLVTASNIGHSSPSRAQVLSSQPLVQNSTFNRQLETNWVPPQLFSRELIVTDHIGNTPFSIVVVQLLQLPGNGLHNTVSISNPIVVEACLLCRCITTAVVSSFVSRSLPSNGSIRHNILRNINLYNL